MSNAIRRRVIVSGLVQGVAFRYSARDAARRIGVSGWVKNLPDGRVEALVEGEPVRVARMVEWLRQGPPSGRVDDVQIREEQPTGEFDGFEIALSRGSFW